MIDNQLLKPHMANEYSTMVPKQRVTPHHTKKGHEEYVAAMAKKAFEKSYLQGREEGYQAGYKEAVEKIKCVDAVVGNFAKGVETLQQSLMEDIEKLVVHIAQAVLQYDLTIAPEKIKLIVSESLNLLPKEGKDIKIIINSLDKELINPTEHNVVLDDSITRGGCVVENSLSRIDATIEERLKQVISKL